MTNIIQRVVPAHMIFFAGKDSIEVMRLTRDGVFVNPDIAVDDAAKVVLDAIDSQIKVLVKRAVEDEREACAKVCEELQEHWLEHPAPKRPGYDLAVAIRARGEK